MTPSRFAIALHVLPASFLAVALAALAANAAETGEILGLNRQERTLTLKVTRPDVKENIVYHVPEGSTIRSERSGARLTFEDLRPGMRVTVTGFRDGERRIATQIVIRGGGS